MSTLILFAMDVEENGLIQSKYWKQVEVSHSLKLTAKQFCKNGKMFLSGTFDGLFILWNTTNYK